MRAASAVRTISSAGSPTIDTHAAWSLDAPVSGIVPITASISNSALPAASRRCCSTTLSPHLPRGRLHRVVAQRPILRGAQHHGRRPPPTHPGSPGTAVLVTFVCRIHLAAEALLRDRQHWLLQDCSDSASFSVRASRRPPSIAPFRSITPVPEALLSDTRNEAARPGPRFALSSLTTQRCPRRYGVSGPNETPSSPPTHPRPPRALSAQKNPSRQTARWVVDRHTVLRHLLTPRATVDDARVHTTGERTGRTQREVRQAPDIYRPSSLNTGIDQIMCSLTRSCELHGEETVTDSPPPTHHATSTPAPHKPHRWSRRLAVGAFLQHVREVVDDPRWALQCVVSLHPVLVDHDVVPQHLTRTSRISNSTVYDRRVRKRTGVSVRTRILPQHTHRRSLHPANHSVDHPAITQNQQRTTVTDTSHRNVVTDVDAHGPRQSVKWVSSTVRARVPERTPSSWV